MEEGGWWGSGETEKEGMVLETLRGKNLQGLVMDWVGKVRWKA